IMYWLNVGAQPSDTVKSLLRQKGIVLKKELASKVLDEEKIKSELENWKKMKEASATKKTDKKLSRKAKAKQQVKEQTSDVESKEQSPAEEPKSEEKSE
ncbi:MAG: 30S ribosomal protein S16, partial [Ignavibacteriales bacterium]